MRDVNGTKVVSSMVESAWLGAEWLVVDEAGDQVVGVVVKVEGLSRQVRLDGLGQALVRELMAEIKNVGEELGLARLVELVEGVKAQVREVEVELVVAVRNQGKLLLVTSGEMEVVLKRGERVGKLLEGKKLVSIQGKVEPGDVVLLGTNTLLARLRTGWVEDQVFGVEGWGEQVERLGERLAVFMGVKQVVNAAVLVLGFGNPAITEEESGKRSVREKIGGWWQQWLQGKERWKGVVVRSGGESKRKVWLRWLVIGLGVVLLVSVGFGWRWQRRQQQKEVIAVMTEPIEALYLRAASDAEVNPLRARSVLAEAKQVIEEKLGEYEEGTVYYKELTSWWQRVEDEYRRVSGEVAVEPAVYLDLSLVREGLFGSIMARAGEWAMVVDGNELVMVKVGLENKQAAVVLGGSDLGGVRMGAGVDGKGYLLVDAGILAVDLEADTAQLAIKQDEAWTDVGAIGAFGDNVYLVDRNKGELWRYKPVAEGDWVRQRWLGSGVSPDFSQVVDMVIDGDIWVLDRDGTVRQYAQGVSTGFGVSGLADSAMDACCLAVEGTEESRRVYVLDRMGKRVIEYGASGEYLRQFGWEGMGVVSDIAVAGGKVLMLAGNRIVELQVR